MTNVSFIDYESGSCSRGLLGHSPARESGDGSGSRGSFRSSLTRFIAHSNCVFRHDSVTCSGVLDLLFLHLSAALCFFFPGADVAWNLSHSFPVLFLKFSVGYTCSCSFHVWLPCVHVHMCHFMCGCLVYVCMCVISCVVACVCLCAHGWRLRSVSSVSCGHFLPYYFETRSLTEAGQPVSSLDSPAFSIPRARVNLAI